MAEKKFSDLTAKGAALADTDLLAISEDAGGGAYTSKSVTGANVKALVTDANMTTTDITTNDVSTSKHGFAPKAPNDTTKFLRGDGTWAVPASGGLTKFTEAENTSAPNGTVYVDSLTAAASSTNADFAIKPKGNGAILAAIPDNTSTGGNKRGANALDLQTVRGAASQVASGASSIVLGSGCTASGQSSISIGLDNGNTGSYGSVAMGRQCSSTNDATIAIGYSSTASSIRAVSLGYLNSASNSYSIAIGSGNTTSGDVAVSLGSSNTSTNSRSICIGTNNTASGAYSYAHGYFAHTFGIYGRQSYANGYIGSDGSSQKSLFVLRVRTTDATATTLTTENTTASSTNQIILTNQSAYRFKGTIIAKQSGSTNAAAWDVDGLIVRGANAAATTLIVSNVNVVSNAPVWGTPTLAADTTNGGLRVQVTGFLATNIQWTATIETTEVIYA